MPHVGSVNGNLQLLDGHAYVMIDDIAAGGVRSDIFRLSPDETYDAAGYTHYAANSSSGWPLAADHEGRLYFSNNFGGRLNRPG